jgi:hypothetical protein
MGQDFHEPIANDCLHPAIGAVKAKNASGVQNLHLLLASSWFAHYIK